MYKLKEMLLDKPKSKIALVLLFGAIIFDTYWLFGLLFIGWIIMDIKNKNTFLFEKITIEDNPIMFWLVEVFWLLCAVYYLGLLFI